MSVRCRTLLSTVALALLGALAVAVPASAQQASYSSKVSFNLGQSAFRGKVVSSNGGCVDRRAVKLFRERYGHRVLLAVTTSRVDGAWSIPTADLLGVGSYYATVELKVEPGLGIRCLGAESRVAILD